MTETANTSILQDLRILAVDDEIDILETIQDLLDESDVDQATDYDSALEKMSEQNYDFAILDIMGVNGMELLEGTVGRNIPTVMLTAHAMNPETLKASLSKGALSYLPKEELFNLPTFLAETLAASRKGKSTTALLFERLGRFFDKTFGNKWAEDDPEYWRWHGYFGPY